MREQPGHHAGRVMLPSRRRTPYTCPLLRSRALPAPSLRRTHQTPAKRKAGPPCLWRPAGCTGAETGKAAGRGPDKRRQAPPAARGCRPALLLLLPFFGQGLRLQHLVSRSTAALPTDRCSATAVKRCSVVLVSFSHLRFSFL